MKIFLVLSILVFSIIVLILFYLSIKKRNKIENKIIRSNFYSIYEHDKRKKTLFALTEHLDLQNFVKFINRDIFYFRALLFYDLNPHINLSFNKDNLDKEKILTESEWKKNLCSQNSLMRKRALEEIHNYSHLDTFIKERFNQENDMYVVNMFLEESKINIEIPDLIKKLKIADDRKTIALIFNRLFERRVELLNYENNIKSLNNAEYTVLLNIVLYPEKFIENIISMMEKEEDDSMFYFLNTIISKVEPDNLEILNRLIVINEKYNDKNEEELSDLSSGNFDTPKNLYLLLYYFENFDNITKDYITGKILRYKNEKLTGALLSTIIRSKDNFFATLLEDIVYNTESIYLRRLGVLGMKKLNICLNRKFVEKMMKEQDIEIFYNLIPLMKNSKDPIILKQLKKLLNNKNSEINELVRNV
ncbi:MAG: hypothetical protein M0R46_07600 [Candidatus Muirbacterium halophilum]|nr:hypothetical protein [Candidatus Muirbacterium halophilum]